MDDLLLVTGDSSSDRYAAHLVTYLQEHGYDGTVYAAAGHRTAEAGAELVENVVDYGVVGLTEIVKSLPFFYSLMQDLDRLLEEGSIGAVLLLDFPGFNLRLARRAHRKGIPLFYYITPQVWAWGQGRVSKLRDWFEELFVIFPFEEEYLNERGANARFVGHPLLQELPEHPQRDLHETLELSRDRRVVSFFPGSRDHEIQRHLRPMGEAAMRIRERDSSLHPVFSAAPTVDQQQFLEILDEEMIEALPVWNGDTHSLLSGSFLTVLTSGTVTMEATFAETPMIVGYRASWITYLAARYLVKSEHFAMPNLIDPEVEVPEFVQSSFNADRLTREILRYTSDKVLRKRQVEGLRSIKSTFADKNPTQEVGDRLLEHFGAREEPTGASVIGNR